MKKTRILAVALSAAMCLALFTACSSDTTSSSSSSSSSSADMAEKGIPQNFILINETGTTLSELMVAPADTEDWTDNVLPQDELESDDTCPVDFYSDEDMDDMIFDIQTKDTDGNKVIYEDVDLSMGIEVTLSTNPDTGAPTADVE